MEGLRKLGGDLIKARREKVRGIKDVLAKGGHAPGPWGRADTISRTVLKPFQRKHSLEIQPRIERLSKISGLTEVELRYLFGRVMNGYVSLLRNAPLSTRATGGRKTLPSVAEEASRDLPALLSDFEVTVRQVKRWSRQIKQGDKWLILSMMRKNNPYILGQLSRDPELKGEFSRSEIKQAVREHKDAKKFLLDSLNMLERLTGDTVISGVFQQFEIRQVVLNHNDGEKLLRSVLPFIQRGEKILKAAGLSATAPQTRLHYLIGKEFVHKDRIDRINVLLQTIKNGFKIIPYATFVKEVSKKPREIGFEQHSIRQQMGPWIAVPKIVLDLYFAQFNSQSESAQSTERT